MTARASTIIPGCMDQAANNFDPEANKDDGSCEYDIPGCMDQLATNYDPKATIDDGSCDFDEPGGGGDPGDEDNPGDGSRVASGVPLLIPVTGVDLDGEFPMYRRLMLLAGSVLLTSGLFMKGTSKKEKKQKM